MTKVSCPFCNFPIEIQNPTADPLVTCIKCGRKANLFRLFWVQKGVKLDSKKQLRCPFCNSLFAEGEYSDRPQFVKCKVCKQTSEFQRIEGFPEEEGDDFLQVKENQGSGTESRKA